MNVGVCLKMENSNTKIEVTKSVLLKSGFWYTFTGFFSKGAVFLTTPLFTRLLTNEQYGNFTVFASWLVIMLTVCSLEVYATINRARFDFTTSKELNAYITSSLFLSTVFTVVIFLTYLFFPAIFEKVFLIDQKYMVFMFIYLLTYPAFGMFQAKQVIEYKYKLNALITFAIVIGSTCLSFFMVLMLNEDRLWGRIVGQYSLYILAGFVFYIFFLIKSISIRAKYIKYALRLSIPLVFSYLGSSILLSSDNLVLKHMCSAREVSYLSITHTCAHIMLILVQFLNNAWSPWFYDKLNVLEYREIRKTFRIYVWLMIIATFAINLVVPEIIIVLGGEKYLEAIYIVPVNILNGIFAILTYQFVNLETYYKKPEYSAIITGCVAVINIVFDIVGVNLLGYRAVCYATLFCQILLVFAHFFCTRKMDIDKILPLRDMCGFIIASIVLIPIALILYQSNMMRWGIIAFLLIIISVVGAMKYRKIFNIIKKNIDKRNSG